MTNITLKAQIDSQITNETAPSSISPVDVGGNMKEIVDYVDQQVPIKTSGTISLTTTPQVLTHHVNSLTFMGGKAYLPTTNVVGLQVYVIANSANIEILANGAGTAKMFDIFNTFITSVTLSQFQMYRFTHIDFGGYWKAELI